MKVANAMLTIEPITAISWHMSTQHDFPASQGQLSALQVVNPAQLESETQTPSPWPHR